MDRRKTDRRLDGSQDLFVFDIQDILNILWRRKALIIGFMLLVLIPGLMFVITKPKIYKATSTAMLEEQDYSITDLQEAMAAAKPDDTTLETQVGLLMSPPLVQQTLSQIDQAAGKTKGSPDTVSDAAINAFFKSFDVAPVGKSRMIAVSFKSDNPKRAADIVNLHVQNFINYRLQTKKEQLRVISEWLTDQMDKLKADSQAKSQKIQEFRDESGIIMGKDSQELIFQQISDLTQQMVPIETAKMGLEAKAASMEAAKDSLPEILKSQTIKELKNQVTSANQELKSLGSHYGKQHPQYLAAKKRLSQVNGDLAREIANVRKSIQSQLDAATQQEALLKARIEELSKQADQASDKSLTLESLQGELDSNKKLFTTYADRFEELKSKMNLSSSDVRVVSKAEMPSQPDGMPKAVLMALIAVFSVIFAFGAVLLLELVDRGIENADDVKRVLNLKLVGILPKVRNPLTEIGGNKRSDYTEELKRIYLSLAGRKLPQSILITATKSGEGKSTVALSLAKYLSSIRAKVIIVDANTSSPSLATLSGTGTVPGFAELMANAADYTKVIHRDDKGLAVIPAGNQDGYPIDILASDAFARMLTSLKAQYDYVLIDCAPVLSTTDAEVISGQVDMVIMVVEWARTAKKELKDAAGILRQYAKEVPSVILNKRS